MTDWAHRHDPGHDFSQSGEQKWIQAFAARRGRPGRFLDLGAYDGVTGSNTRWLAMHGWQGVCVEPAAAAFHALAELYASEFKEATYPQVQCVQTLVADGDSPLTPFFYSPTDLVSTTDYDHFRLWKDDARFVPVHTSKVTLDELLAYFCDRQYLEGRYFDLVSIDTEGTALELLTQLRRHEAWRDVAMVIVEFQDGEQEYEIHEICGVDEWAVCERTSNNIVLERT